MSSSHDLEELPPQNGDRCKGQKNYSDDQLLVLKKWFLDNWENPYLTREQLSELCQKTGLDKRQVSNWFLNARKRHWKPLNKKGQNRGKSTFIFNI